MKQTAVEWFVEQLNINGTVIPMAIEYKAKEMEKQQQGYSEEEVIEIIKLSCEKVKIPYMRIKDFTIRMFEQYKKK
jgi:hypothetical protein